MKVRFLGSEAQDVQLACLLRDEVAVLAQLDAQRGGYQPALAERLQALVWRCQKLVQEYPNARPDAEAIIADVASADSHIFQCIPPAQQLKLRSIIDASSDDTAVKLLTHFYTLANPENLDGSNMQKIWRAWRHRPLELSDQLLAKYGDEYSPALAWLTAITPAEKPAEKPAAPSPPKPQPAPTQQQPQQQQQQRGRTAEKERGRSATPSGKPPSAPNATPKNQKTPSSKRSSSAVRTLLGYVASPVVRLFRPEDDDAFPQAILPDEEEETRYYYDKNLGRWVFPDDVEGEKERAALDAAKNGPPPPPGPSASKPAGGGASGGYLDSFNAGGPPPAAASMKAPVPGYVDPFNTGSGGGGPPPAAAMPPMPPMPPLPPGAGDD